MAEICEKDVEHIAIVDTRIFEDVFEGSIRCCNGVRLALMEKYHWNFTRREVTVDMVLSLSERDISRLPNFGKKTVSEFAKWKEQQGLPYPSEVTASISHWGHHRIDFERQSY